MIEQRTECGSDLGSTYGIQGASFSQQTGERKRPNELRMFPRGEVENWKGIAWHVGVKAAGL